MKRALTLLLALCMCLTLFAGCSSDSKKNAGAEVEKSEWQDALTLEAMENCTIDFSLKTKTKGSVLSESINTVEKQSGTLKCTEDSVWLELTSGGETTTETFTGTTADLTRTEYLTFVLAFADSYRKFEYDSGSKSYSLKKDYEVDMEGVSMSFSDCQLTFNKSGQLTQFSFSCESSVSGITMTAEGEYQFSDYGSTKITNSDKSNTTGKTGSKVDEDGWKTALSKKAMENVTADCSGTVTIDGQTTTMSSTLKYTAEAIQQIGEYTSLGQTNKINLVYTAEEYAAMDDSEDWLHFANNYNDFQYNSAKGCYELKEEYVMSEAGATITYTVCELTFSDGRLQKLYYEFDSHYGSGDTTYIMYDYGTTAIPDDELKNADSKMTETEWKNALSGSAFTNCTLRMTTEYESLSSSNTGSQTATFYFTQNKVRIIAYADGDSLNNTYTTTSECNDARESGLALVTVLVDYYENFSYNSVYTMTTPIVATIQGETVIFQTCTLEFNENGALASMVFEGMNYGSESANVSATLTFYNYNSTTIS